MQSQNLEIENQSIPFLFYLPKELDDMITDYAYVESKATGKRIYKSDVCRQALKHFFKCLKNEPNQNQT